MKWFLFKILKLRQTRLSTEWRTRKMSYDEARKWNNFASVILIWGLDCRIPGHKMANLKHCYRGAAVIYLKHCYRDAVVVYLKHCYRGAAVVYLKHCYRGRVVTLRPQSCNRQTLLKHCYRSTAVAVPQSCRFIIHEPPLTIYKEYRYFIIDPINLYALHMYIPRYLCPGHRPRAQVIICVGFFFLFFYLCPGHRPWAQVIICVGVFFFLFYFSSARKWTNCAIVPIRPMRPSRLNEDLNRRH